MLYGIWQRVCKLCSILVWTYKENEPGLHQSPESPLSPPSLLFLSEYNFQDIMVRQRMSRRQLNLLYYPPKAVSVPLYCSIWFDGSVYILFSMVLQPNVEAQKENTTKALIRHIDSVARALSFTSTFSLIVCVHTGLDECALFLFIYFSFLATSRKGGSRPGGV